MISGRAPAGGKGPDHAGTVIESLQSGKTGCIFGPVDFTTGLSSGSLPVLPCREFDARVAFPRRAAPVGDNPRRH